MNTLIIILIVAALAITLLFVAFRGKKIPSKAVHLPSSPTVVREFNPNEIIYDYSKQTPSYQGDNEDPIEVKK